MEKKEIVFSAVQNHKVIKKVIDKLKKIREFKINFHDPTKHYFSLSEIPEFIKNANGMIVKVRNECSVDLLHYAKLYNIPALHDIDSVLVCKNKIALDYYFRKIFEKYHTELAKFELPNSWNQNLSDVEKFKEWASKKLPIVIKSHYQHDKYNRFNFLVQHIDDVEIFCERYSEFLYYDVYVQKFIECDGIERKIYVIGDKAFGIKRENPIYKFLRERPDQIDVSLIERDSFEITEDIRQLSKILSKELNLRIFGFDLVKPIDQDILYLIDLNDFPSFQGIDKVEDDLTVYLKDFIFTL
ncbi:MAG: RimK family alpha-L-glutamate ligase [Candidatus Hermodarchaeota archaeon]